MAPEIAAQPINKPGHHDQLEEGCSPGASPTEVEATKNYFKVRDVTPGVWTQTVGGTGHRRASQGEDGLALTAVEGSALRVYMHSRQIGHGFGSENGNDDEEEVKQEVHHAHGHAEKPLSLASAAAAAIINFLLMFGLCSAYGMIMFYDPWHKKLAPLGVKMNLGTAMIAGALLAVFSKVPVAIGGPDLNPVVFIAGMIDIAAKEIATDVGLVYPEIDHRRLLEECAAFSVTPLDIVRRLGASSEDEEWCRGDHYDYHTAECDDYMKKLKATVALIVFASTAALGLVYTFLGTFKMTRYVSYLPTSIVEAFLSCIGYKVFKYAIKFCYQEPKQFLPAACIGVIMYFMKAMHIGNPAIVLPLILFLPLGVFYIITFSMGKGIDDLRKEKLMFDEIEDMEFWKIWSDGLFKVGDISWTAWAKTLVDLAIMIIVCTMDCLLKISATGTKMPVKVDTDYEAKLYGLSNVPVMLSGCTVGYMQLKFNVISYGILGNVKDRRAGLMYAALCGVCFFGTLQHLNYMPRFFLGTMLFFAGAGFVAENLWGSRQYLNMQEWLQIIIILIVFAVTESMLYAVLVGGILTAVHFVLQYSKVPCTVGEPAKGCRGLSRTHLEMVSKTYVDHIAAHQTMVVKLKGFIFFASAQKLLKDVIRTVELDQQQPEYRRLKHVIFDCSRLDSMDASALKGFMRLKAQIESMHARLLWAGISPTLLKYLSSRGLIAHSHDWYHDLADAVSELELEAAQYIGHIQDQWANVHPFFALHHAVALQQHSAEPFHGVLTSPASRMGVPWQFCGRMKIKKYETILWSPGGAVKDKILYLVHRGSVGVFPGGFINRKKTSASEESEVQEIMRTSAKCEPPTKVYTHGCFMNVEVLEHRDCVGYGIALEDGEVVYWDEASWQRMMRKQPHMATAIMLAAMNQLAQQGEARQEALDAEGEAHSMGIGAPRNLQTAARSMYTARRLASLGFFDLEEQGKTILPQLPLTFRKDLEIAFATFTIPQEDEKEARIAWPDVVPALHYAGIFAPWLKADCTRGLTRQEFLSLGNHMLLARLTQEQVELIHSFFNLYDGDKSGTLDVDELVQVLRETLDPSLREEEVTGIALAIDNTHAHSLTREEFVVLFAWLIMQNVSTWLFLRGVEETMGSEAKKIEEAVENPMQLPRRLSTGAISKKTPNTTEAEAQEMMWVADVYHLPSAAEEGLSFQSASSSASGSGTKSGASEKPTNAASIHASSVAALLAWGHRSRNSLPPESVLPVNLKSKAAEQLPNADVSDIFQDPRCLEPWRAEWHCPLVLQRDRSERFHAEDMKAAKTIVRKLNTWEESKKPPPTLQARVGTFLEEPTSSTGAHIFSLGIGVIILLSVILLVLEPLALGDGKESSINSKGDDKIYWYFDAFCTAIFVMEYLARLATASAIGYSSTFSWMIQPLNIADLVALLPFFLDVAFSESAGELRLMRIARLMRLSRIVRMGRLASKSKLFPPVAAVLVVIWGIYLKTSTEE